MKLGWFTPFGPRSIIGNYSEAAVNGLAAADDVTVFAAELPGHGEPRPSPLPVVRVPAHLTVSWLEQLRSFDLLVYNMGNYTPYHETIYEAAQCCPGLVILHDLVMRDFFRGYFLAHSAGTDTLQRLMTYSHGPEAHLAADSEMDRLTRPLFLPLLRRGLGAVVHSEYARGRVEEVAHVPCEKVDFPLFGPAVRLADSCPTVPRPPGDRIHLLSIGHVIRNKLIHATVDAIAHSDFLRERVRFTVIGSHSDTAYCDRLRADIQRHRLGETIRLVSWLSERRLTEAVRNADAIVNLRNPHTGESSASLLDALVAGTPTVVWNHGSYAEVPDDVVCKIAGTEELAPLLERLVRDGDWRQQIGRNARDYARERFQTTRYCEQFRAFVATVLYHKPLLCLADRVSDRLLEMGAQPDDDLATRLAAELSLFAPDDEHSSRLARVPAPTVPRARAG